MSWTPRNLRLLLSGLLVFGLALVIVVNFTDACKLETVRVNGKPLPDWTGTCEMLRSAAVINQPVDDLASLLLAKSDIYRVDISYRLPGELEVTTNRFEPVCFVVGEESGKLFGLNRKGRLIYLDGDGIDFEQPVFTGLKTGAVHSFCEDPRVAPVIDQLEQLRKERGDLYRLIDELDFSRKDHLGVTLAGVSYPLMVRTDHLLEDFDRFIDFTLNYETDLAGVTRLDLRYDDMVICAKDD